MITDHYEELQAKVGQGEPLTDSELEQLAASHDILQLGALADVARRRIHSTRVTYARVAARRSDAALTEAISAAAGEVRLIGPIASLADAVAAVRSAKDVAGARLVSGFSLSEVQTMAHTGTLSNALIELHAAGLEMLAEVPLDGPVGLEPALEALVTAGIEQVRLTIDRMPAPQRYSLFAVARGLKERFPAIRALNPLPMTLNAFRPTTGYDDTKSVALDRLAAPNIPTIQVDWLRYGPKLAQVALAFGADDLDGVAPDDDASGGVRRTARAEVVRNIEAAGFAPVERDGRFSSR